MMEAGISSPREQSSLTMITDHTNLYPFLASHAFSDFTLIVGNQTFQAHRIVLYNKSDFFKSLLPTLTSSEFHFDIADPHLIFPSILRFLYTGEISISKDTLPDVLTFAERLQIGSLKKALSSRLHELVGANNAFDVMLNALQYSDSEHIVIACADIIAANFPQMEELVLKLEIGLIIRILASSRLCIKSEEYLLSLVRQLIETRNPTEPQISSLLSVVGYRDLSAEKLQSLFEEPLIQQYAAVAVLNGIGERIQMLEGKKFPRTHERQTFSIKWDTTACAPSITVKKSGAVILKTGNDNGTVRAKEPLPPTGQHYWETVFYHKDKSRSKGTAMGNCYYTGIVQDLGSNITWTESMCESQSNWDYAWGLHDNGATDRGERKHKGKSHRYATGFGDLQKVGVLVDMDAHTLSYFIDGESYGVAFHKIPSDHIYPCVTIFNDEMCCKISAKSVPSV